MARGLVQWTALLGRSESILDQAPAQSDAAIVLFAVLDPVAAVGLWLAAPWGGVLWLLAVAAQVVAVVAIPGFVSPLWIGVDGLAVAVYFLLNWLSLRSPGIRRPRSQVKK
jgi:hypothetical protein